MALALAAAFVPPDHVLGRIRLVDLVRGGGTNRRGRFVTPPLPLITVPPPPQQPLQPPAAAIVFDAGGSANRGAVTTASSPTLLPLIAPPSPIVLPTAVSNLTKLDLVSVTVTALPHLDNIKYLHLKWVLFTSADPFSTFRANKLQSFVMNNCIGPQRSLRFVKIFVVLSRAPQLMRMELVATRFIDGLLEHLIDREEPPASCFRNLQRLVMAGNKDATEVDVGLLLVAGQQSLTHVALQLWHSRNSLFEALLYSGVRLHRLESLVLGYQDPFRSRLTPSELSSLDLVDNQEAMMPICYITDRGLELVFGVCPRLTSLTLRHAPFISRFPRLRIYTSSSSTTTNSNPSSGVDTSSSSASSSGTPGQEDTTAAAAETATVESEKPEQESPEQQQHTCLPLRSLTLENCPNIGVEELERVIATGDPFGLFDSLVLRDMLPLRRETAFNGEYNSPKTTWTRRWLNNKSSGSCVEAPIVDGGLARNWKLPGLLLSAADLLWAMKQGFSPMAPTGVGLGASAREVTHVGLTGVRLVDIPVKPFDAFFTLRMHTYMSSLLQLDGSCGPRSLGQSRIRRLLLSTKDNSISVKTPSQPSSSSSRPPVGAPSSAAPDFVSQSTQTCICGLLEFDFVQRYTLEQRQQQQGCRYIPAPPSSSSQQQPTSSSSRSSPNQQNQQVGGHLAFHPFHPTSQHQALYQHATCSEWARSLISSLTFNELQTSLKRFVRPLAPFNDCPGCSSGVDNPPSMSQAETHLTHKPRIWMARDACVDTSELRCHVGPKPCVFTLCQPPSAPYSCLTTVHFEKVGISHLVLSGVPRLKNITLENCSALRGIIVHPVAVDFDASLPSTSSAPTFVVNPIPSLRRVRIIRCPKFAIYHWLHTAAKMYPQHYENLFITYRPFGEYCQDVESALWDNAQAAHVMVTHDYSQNKSERAMEETHSALDQRFREIMTINDALIRRDLPPCFACFDGGPPEPIIRSEYGEDWDLSTDTFITEDTCGLMAAASAAAAVAVATASPPSFSSLSPNTPPPPSDPHSVAQFYSLLREVYNKQHKFCRRGIHLHVQYRDVHEVGSDGCGASGSYLMHPYTEAYLRATPPQDDFNVWGDGFNESLWPHLPPPSSHSNNYHYAPTSKKRRRENDETDPDHPSSPKLCRRRSISQFNNVNCCMDL